MIKRLLYILIICLFAVNSWGATYNYYFSDDATGNATGNDGNNCTSSGTACKTLSKLNTLIDALGSGDTVNAYFDRSDTWSCDTEALSGGNFCFSVSSTNPVLNFQAYGSGNDPIFDGEVTDFSAVADSNCGGAPCFYSLFFKIEREDCSFDNITIQGVYGVAIQLGSATSDADGFSFSNGTIHDFGSQGIQAVFDLGIEDATVEYSTFYNGERLLEHEKKSGWGAAIGLIASQSGAASMCKNNLVRYNLVYDIYGEGINAPNSIIEYNVVGDTGSIGINIAPHDFDALTAVVRYNFVIMSDWNISIYDGLIGSNPVGIRVYDERVGADNSAADVSIYGNVVINRQNGIWIFSNKESGNPFGSIKVYNNVVIDSHGWNITIGDEDEFTLLYIYNNSSILYDRGGVTEHTTNFTPEVGWDIDHNAFYHSSGSPNIDSDFDSNKVTGNPLLPGEPSVDWDGQTGTYWDNIDFETHLLPTSGALLDEAKALGAGYTDNLPTTGTDWKAGVDGVFVLNTGGGDIGPFSVDGSVGSGTGLEGIIPLGVILQ